MSRRHGRPVRIGLIGAVALLFAVPAFGAPGDVFWEAEYDRGGNDIAYDLVVAPDGSAVFASVGVGSIRTISPRLPSMPRLGPNCGASDTTQGDVTMPSRQ